MRGCQWWFVGNLSLVVVLGMSASMVAYGQSGAAESADNAKAKSDQSEVQVAAERQSSTESGPGKEFQLPAGLSWQSNLQDPIFADPRALKGGEYRGGMMSFPPTLRQVGPDSNTGFRGVLAMGDMYLVAVHPNTGKHIPSLATHWAVAADNKTVYYKLHPQARWSTGEPVTADDYVFTLEFMRSPHIVSPWHNNYYSQVIADVVKHTDHIISVVAAKKHMTFNVIEKTNIAPIPKHFHRLDKDWVRKYTWRVSPNTGPYYVSEYKKGKYVRFQRKQKWWANDLKYQQYRHNADVIHYKVVRDPEALWQAFLKEDLTLHGATLPSVWHQKAQGEHFDKGYITKLKFYYQKTESANMIWLNERQAPFDDQNVRYAFAHALNFDKVIAEVLRGDYLRLQSFHVGYGDYDNPAVKARGFDIVKAGEYMKKSGYSLGKNGMWQKGGKALQITLTYGWPFHTPRLVVLKEEAKKAGFDIVLEQLDPTSSFKKGQEKSFQAYWSNDSEDPTPPPSYWKYFHSDNAKPQTSNLTMTANPVLDALIESYEATFDEDKKAALSRQILQQIHDIGSFIPGFYYQYARLLYWSYWKFPQVPGTKMGSIDTSLMWFDQAAADVIREHKKKGTSLGKSEIIDTTYRPQ